MPNHTRELADFTTDRRVLALSAIAILIGILASFVAVVLLDLIQFFTNLCFYGKFSLQPATPIGNHLGPWVIVMPAIGGLVIGYMARYGSEKIRGHGIPEALEAILLGGSQMEPKVAVLKPLSSAISIGTGGPYGAEGPIIMTAGAFGSLIAQFIKLSSAERKTLLVAGAAAGMAAIFATPIAAVLLALELLLFEWKPRSLIPVSVAAVTAGVARSYLLGQGPIFPVPPHGPMNLTLMVFALGVGLIGGLVSSLLTTMVYGFEDLFKKLPVHWMWWPAIGGIAVGIGGYIDPRVLGVGYQIIHSELLGQVVGPAVLGILIGKAVVWSLSLGSSTSGGILAPLLMVGGAMGAFEAGIIPYGNAALWATISMAAVMGGTMRAPLTAIIFTLELTHDLNLLPGLLIASIASTAVTVLIMKRSILTEKVARRGHHLVYEYTIDPMTIHRVGEIMVTDVPKVKASATAEEVFQSIAKDPQALVRRQGAPIVDSSGHLVGIVTQGDILRALQQGSGNSKVTDIGSTTLVVTYDDELLSDAVIKMLQNDIGRLPVVSREDEKKLVGYVDRSHIMAGRMKWYEEEHHRDQRWKVSKGHIRQAVDR